MMPAVKPYVETRELGYLWAVVGFATLAAELVGGTRRRGEATQKDRGSSIVLRVCLAPSPAIVIFAPRIVPGAAIHPAPSAVIAGLVIFAAGEGLRIWARATLGRYFTYTVMTSDDQPVITAGPYRAVRHPSYSGLLLMALGAGAIYGNWLAVGGLGLLMLIAVVYRIRVEERALLADLGEPYRRYAAGHKRLLPRVW